MKRILLIDDDKDMASLTKTTLLKQGYDVEVFHEPIGGIERAKEYKPDLILMDVMLPGMNGAEAVSRLKADNHLKDIPVIFLTALVSHGEKFEDTGLNVDGRHYRTLGKPYEIEELLKEIQSTLTPQELENEEKESD